jgi:hypothetical protein
MSVPVITSALDAVSSELNRLNLAMPTFRIA